MMRSILLAANEDDAYGWLRRHRHEVLSGGLTALVWPGRFHTLEGGPSFDRLAVTAAAFHMSVAIAACLTRIKGPDGLTPGQRLNPDEIGARMRGAT